VSAWLLLLLVYASFAAGVYAATADIAQALLASLGLHAGWAWLGLAGAFLALALAFTSIGFSSLVILACEGASVALITAVAFAVLAAGGYLGSPVGVAVDAAGLVSAFGAQLACLNAAARLLYALGREAGAPGRFLTRTWARHGSPAGALAVAGAASIAGLAAFSAEPTATRAATLIIQYGAYLILAAYLLTVIAALAWTWRTRRRPLPLAVLAAGVAVLGYVLYRTFVPFPAAPFGWVVAAAAVSAAIGAGFLLIPGLLARLRSSPLLAVTAAARSAQRP
jgi:amino acid transporter